MTVLDVAGVTFRRRGTSVLRNVTFSIAEHELVGLIGPNGGGKTTLLQVVLGVLRPESGRVRVFGTAPAQLGRERSRIGYVAQARAFDRSFPARAKDVVLMGTFGRLGPFRYPGAVERARALATLDEVDMREKANRPIGRLSGGEQQRVFIAQALVSHPRLLILDEPTAGVDPEGEDSLLHLLLRLKNESKLTILMVSHNVSLIRAHTDRILCLNRDLFFAGAAGDLSDRIIAEAYHAHEPEDAGA